MAREHDQSYMKPTLNKHRSISSNKLFGENFLHLPNKYLSNNLNTSIENGYILSKYHMGNNCMPKEIEEGNIEYKRKLNHNDKRRLEHLTTQLKWRLEEGCGVAFYELGVENNGEIRGISPEELDVSIECLKIISIRANSAIIDIHKIKINDNKFACEVVIKSKESDCEIPNIRVALLGDTGSGKSTLVGVLLHGELDDCNGRARNGLLKHPHEILSGRTSSIYQELIGFDYNGKLVNFSSCSCITNVIKSSKKLVNLIDLAGYHKYLRTTINGLFSFNPHLVFNRD